MFVLTKLSENAAGICQIRLIQRVWMEVAWASCLGSWSPNLSQVTDGWVLFPRPNVLNRIILIQPKPGFIVLFYYRSLGKHVRGRMAMFASTTFIARPVVWRLTAQKVRSSFNWTSWAAQARHIPGSLYPRRFLIFGLYRRKDFIQAFLSAETERMLRKDVCKLSFDWDSEKIWAVSLWRKR